MSYKKPPKATQFKKGQSGNPKGRPPKKQPKPNTLADDLIQELQSEVLVNQNGEVTRITKQRALIAAILTTAINGRVGQQRLMIKLCAILDTGHDHNTTEPSQLTEFDTSLLSQLNKIGLNFDGADNDT